MTPTEELVRDALNAGAQRFSASPDAWADNRGRLRRRTWLQVSLATVAVAGTAAVAVALPRSPGEPVQRVRPATPPPSATTGGDGLDRHGLPPADVETLTRRCAAAFDDPSSMIPLAAPVAEYEPLFVLPGVRIDGDTGTFVTVQARDQVLTCHSALRPPVPDYWRTWAMEPKPTRLYDIVEGDPYGNPANPAEWSAVGRYAADVARIDVTPVPGDPPVAAVLDNGVWVAFGTATDPVPSPRDVTYPRIRGYAADGRLLFDSLTSPGYQCHHHLHDVAVLGIPDPDADCGPTWPWP